jgi:hypothetical protein
MRDDLVKVMLRECYCTVSTLQLSKAELPQKYEQSLSETNIAIQESITVK